jgi:LPS-assembly protein
MKFHLILFAIVLLSNSIKAQGVTPSCEQNGSLFPVQTLSSDTENVDIIADYSEVIKKDLYHLKGDVSLISDKYYLSADEVTVQQSSKTAKAKGNVKFQGGSVMLLGSNATIKKQGDLVFTDIDDVTYHYPSLNANGTAARVSGNKDEMAFDDATYTLCPLGNRDWTINADKIKLNSKDNKGTARSATVKFLGVPILYTPYHSWVMKGRGSGFLSPSFSSYTETSGKKDRSFQTKIPYYFNIAPDRDFLLTLNQMTSRGSVVEGKYRQLIPKSSDLDSGSFEIETQYLNKDKITNKKRWLLDSMLDMQLNEKTSVSVGINRVSDSNYFKEISHSNTSLSALNSYIGLKYYDKDDELSISALSESEQTLSSSSSYVKQPEISLSKKYNLDNSRVINITAVSTNFAHKDSNQTTGVRTHTGISFEHSIVTNAYSLTPKLGMMYTNYSLDNAADKDRYITSFGLDSKMFLEREVSLFNVDSIQTLTPRIAYHYTPKKDQSAIPNFDSTDKDDSYYGLFSPNKFTGLDRISNANSFTVGLESDFISTKSDESFISLKVAQTFHIDDQEMNSSGAFVNRRKYSDIAASVDLKFNNFSLNNSLQYDPQKNQINKRDNSLNYFINPRKFLTLAHHDDNGILSAELYGSYPITPNIHVFAGVNRSISNSTTNKKTAGIAYESCCWAVRFAHFKNTSGDNVNKVELVLKGLASTSTAMSKRLDEDIPNYLANLDDL